MYWFTLFISSSIISNVALSTIHCCFACCGYGQSNEVSRNIIARKKKQNNIENKKVEAVVLLMHFCI